MMPLLKIAPLLLAVPYEAPKTVKIMAAAQPRAPKNGCFDPGGRESGGGFVSKAWSTVMLKSGRWEAEGFIRHMPDWTFKRLAGGLRTRRTGWAPALRARRIGCSPTVRVVGVLDNHDEPLVKTMRPVW